MNTILKIASLMAGASLMTSLAAAGPDPASDLRIDPQIRAFLAEINKDSAPFWELPQPKPQEILTSLQSQTSVDMSGVAVTEKTITQDGRTVKLYIMKPTQVGEKPGVLLFIHGGVWIVGNFQNHQRLLRDLVVGSGQIGVFVEYTPLPAAKFPTQLEESYAALKWLSEHDHEIGADGSRIAVAGNSVGGNMTAALNLMAKDRNGPKISYQVLLIPATDASVGTEAENDPLRDEGEAYARKLKEAGVSVDAVRYNGTIHDFVLLNALRHVPSTEAAIDQINAGLRQHLEMVTH